MACDPSRRSPSGPHFEPGAHALVTSPLAECLELGAFPDGTFLKRSGASLIGDTPPSGGAQPSFISDVPDDQGLLGNQAGQSFTGTAIICRIQDVIPIGTYAVWWYCEMNKTNLAATVEYNIRIREFLSGTVLAQTTESWSNTSTTPCPSTGFVDRPNDGSAPGGLGDIHPVGGTALFVALTDPQAIQLVLGFAISPGSASGDIVLRVRRQRLIMLRIAS